MAANHQDEQASLALFIDFENIAIGVRDAHYRKFDVNLVLERLLDKGKLLVKKAYADWSRYSDYKRSFHEAAIELIEVPQKSVGGKNSADIRLVVDAMDMSFQKEHINCFVVASGDSDFSPLVSQAQGEQQVRDRAGGQELDLRPAASRTATSSSSTRTSCAASSGRCPRSRNVPEKVAGVLRAARGLHPGAAAREQGGPLGLHGQGDHEAQEALLQRDLLRLPHLQPPAGGRAAARHRGCCGATRSPAATSSRTWAPGVGGLGSVGCAGGDEPAGARPCPRPRPSWWSPRLPPARPRKPPRPRAARVPGGGGAAGAASRAARPSSRPGPTSTPGRPAIPKATAAETDEHDDLEDAGPGAEEAGSGDEASGVDSRAEMAPARETPSAEQDRTLPGHGETPERAPFSLFSWIRRDPGQRPAPAPDAEHGAGPGKPDPLE